MSIKISAADILLRMVRDQPAPALTGFDLYILARRLLRDRSYRGVAIPARTGQPSQDKTRKLLFQIAEHRGWTEDLPLRLDPDFQSDIYILEQRGSVEDILMLADPFCALSHATAIERHGLADMQMPDIHVTSPRGTLWQQLAFAWTAEHLQAAGEKEWPQYPFALMKPRHGPSIRDIPVHRHETLYPSIEPPLLIDNIRVTALGTTFRDMVTDPALCGGMARVVEIWRRHAEAHLDTIITAIDLARAKLTRVRAGYMLDELLGLSDPRIERWVADAQRGSSQKLDPARPYIGAYSEKWMISLNLTAPTLYTT